MPLTRRTFIKAGAIGGGVLVAAGAWEAWRLRSCKGEGNGLSPAGRALFSAVIPALLEGMVPVAAWTPSDRAVLVEYVDRTVAQLPAAARDELRQLACLLDQGPVRLLLAGTLAPWEHIEPAQAARILTRWRFSSTAMLVSAYQALRDITFATWYAGPAHWAHIGYPGPPQLTGPAA